MMAVLKNASPIEKLLLIGAPVLIALSAWLQLGLPAESDKGWLLHAARVWLEGHKLYVDVVEVNPPLVVWYYSIPVWFSMHIPGVTDSEMHSAFGLVLCGLSVWLCVRFLQLHPAFAENPLLQAEIALLLGLIHVFFTNALYFADRDHIFAVLTFPYIIRFMPSLADQKPPLRLRVLAGAMAAVGFCMKPHTIIVFTTVQLLVLLRKQRFSALLSLENCIIAAFAVFYLCAVLLLTPEYVSTILPIALATYSEFANHGDSWVYVPPWVAALGLVFADFRPRYSTPYRKDVYYLLPLSVAFIAYGISNNGWGYTFCPMHCFILFTTGWMLIEYEWIRRETAAKRLPRHREDFGIRGCAIVFLLNGAFMFSYVMSVTSSGPVFRSNCEMNPACWHREGPIVNYVHVHNIHSFGTLSLDFSKWVALLRVPGIRWETRFNHLWMIAKLQNFGEGFIQGHLWILDYMGKSLADDLNRRKPEIVFTDTSDGFMGGVRRFDYAAFLSRVPEFKEAWKAYRYTTTVDTCGVVTNGSPSECRYDIFTRAP